MNRREELQEKWSDTWIRFKSGILYLEMRSGKIKTSILCFNKLGINNPKILIAYPDNKIKNSWEKDFEKFDYNNPNVIFTNFSSLKKYTNQKFDLLVLDEIHELSEFEFTQAALIKDNSKYHLGLTGTISYTTQEQIDTYLKLPIIERYTKEEAILDNIVTDYQISIHTIPLDNKVLIKQKNGKLLTEKRKYDNLTFIFEKLKKEKKNTQFIAISRANILKKSISRLEYVKKLLKEYKNERCLVFGGFIEQITKLGIPHYHSKMSDDTDFQSFISGEGKHFGLVGIGKAGITYYGVDRLIIFAFSSNSEELNQTISRITMQEWDGKIAKIDIITSNEFAEIKRLNEALSDFDSTKITWK